MAYNKEEGRVAFGAPSSKKKSPTDFFPVAVQKGKNVPADSAMDSKQQAVTVSLYPQNLLTSAEVFPLY